MERAYGRCFAAYDAGVSRTTLGACAVFLETCLPRSFARASSVSAARQPG